MNYCVVFLSIIVLFSSCATTPPADQAARAAVVEKPFDDMIANAHPPEVELGIIEFAYDKAYLTDTAKSILDQIAREVSDRSGLVIIEGHADHNNTDEYNIKLGYKRALTAADYLRSAGVWDERLVIRSFGEARPAASNWSDEGRAVNRRVVVKMFDQGEGMDGKKGSAAYSRMISGEKKSQPTLFEKIMNTPVGDEGSEN